MEQQKCALHLRNFPLGVDRHGRLFWKLEVCSCCAGLYIAMGDESEANVL